MVNTFSIPLYLAIIGFEDMSISTQGLSNLLGDYNLKEFVTTSMSGLTSSGDTTPAPNHTPHMSGMGSGTGTDRSRVDHTLTHPVPESYKHCGRPGKS